MPGIGPQRVDTVGEALKAGTATLEAARVPDAEHDAGRMLADLLGVDRGGLFVRRSEALDPKIGSSYEARLARRANREPLQHILGTQEFHGLSFRIDGRAMIPRHETEGIVDTALGLDLPPGARVADLGTGSGCIAITLAVRRPDLELDALDRSSAALELARENAVRHAVAQRVRFVEGDLRSPPADWIGRFDLVVSNPPYVPEAEYARLQPEVRDHDPREALVGGASGLEIYEALASSSLELLRPGGWMLAEIGMGQWTDVSRIAVEAGFVAVEVEPDLRGIPRVVVARKGSVRQEEPS